MSLSDAHQLSAAWLRTLESAFHGRRVAQEVETRLMGRTSSPISVEQGIRVMTRVQRWARELQAGKALVAPRGSDTEVNDATVREVVDLMLDLKLELKAVAGAVTAQIRPEGLPPQDDQLVFLVGALVRQAHGRERYVRLLIETGGRQSQAARQRRQALLPTAVEGLRRADAFVDRWPSCGGPDAQYIDLLRKEAAPLAGLFRAQIHDINLLEVRRLGELLPLTLDFSPEEAAGWKELPLAQAGYWRAFGFGPADASLWIACGVRQPMDAATWARAGFQPVDAMPWHAAHWLAHRARRAVDAGYSHPDEVPPR